MDTGLPSLVAIARFHQLPAEPEQLAHQFAEPGKLFFDTQLLSAAKTLILRDKRVSSSLSQSENDTLLAIAKSKDGASSFLHASERVRVAMNQIQRAHSLFTICGNLRRAPSRKRILNPSGRAS
jgi:subfamily B ATP-binding cassette protein HlyB/CyaB